MSETVLWWCRCVGAKRMLGGVPAVCPYEAVRLWLFSHLVHGGGNGMHDVVVEGSACERESTGLSELLVQAQSK